MPRRVTEKQSIGWFTLAIAIVATGFFSALAAPPNYFTRTWQVEQGLPQNKVTAVVQTRDGYLWVGTYNGLARFDGVRFTVFNDNNTPELHSSRITSLFEASDGTLWISTESGEVSQYKDGHFAAVPLRANWSGGKIYAIASDEAGDVWLMNEAGELARVRDGQVLRPAAGVIAKVIALTRSASGQIWVDCEGRVSLLKQGQLQPVEFAVTNSETYPYIQGIAASRDGGLWVASNSSIRKWKDGKWTADLGAAPWGWSVVPNLAETSAGVLAGGSSGEGLWLFFAGQTNTPALHLNHTNGLPSDWVISLWEDREKNLWCGSGAGLVVIRPNNLETVSPPDKWKNCPVLSVLPAPDGALWVGTEGAGLYRLQDGGWTNFDSAQGIRNSYIWSLAADAKGKIWAGTWGGGLFVESDGRFDFAPGLENFLPPMPALLFLGDELWIGTTTTGALRYRDGKLERFSEIAGQPFGDVRAIARDRSGTLWFGTAGGGLVRLRDGNWCRFKKASGLSSDFIECLYSADDGALWIGTFGGGLNRLKDGEFSVINHGQGLPNGVIGHIESDGLGNLWMSSYGGILRASEADLNRCADGKISEVLFLAYGINDGLPTLECSEGMQSAGGKTADGRLWFPTAKGLVMVDPAGTRINSRPPPVRIEEMRVDDKKFADGYAAGPLKVPPGRHRIEFEYNGLSFVAPEKVRFKCRLNNLETEWADVGTKRVATYNYIPPGSYTFQVIACNNDGVWNKTGASLKFEVLPYFWQTLWFRVLCGVATVLLASAVVWFDTRRRMRRKLERAERQRDIERERSRIAQDIHDDLGAQLTRITMMSESARGELANPERAAAGLGKIYDTARELTRSMDEIVWAVSPRHDTLEGLATYLEKFAHDWLATAGFRCRLDLPLQFPEWHLTSEVRHNVFLAFKEALHNAVKHSRASEVLIRLTVKEKSFELAVEDNGRGFGVGEKTKDVSSAHGRAASGNGLENMRRRLAGIGGSCEIQSAPGAGTQVIFSVQLKASVLGKPAR
ncbi:MAG TPA: two-component regulator propeller domain-containing protein [Verrucomicrobiae bacterium]|nr:two-component regulator propeller domain-containing protein [Verrucomicrobiae bacterium]